MSEETGPDGKKLYRLKADPGLIGIAPTPLRHQYVQMRCGKCHGTDFQVHVEPQGETARVAVIVCVCGSNRTVGEDGLVQSIGRLDLANGVN